MTFLEARGKIVQALDTATNVLHNPRLAPALRDPGADVKFIEMELDSLAALECCLLLEDGTGLEFDPAHFERYESVNALAEFIARNAQAQ